MHVVQFSFWNVSAFPRVAYALARNCRALNWFNVFFKLKLAKPQEFAEFTLFDFAHLRNPIYA